MTTKTDRVNVNITREPYHRVFKHVAVDLEITVGRVIELMAHNDQKTMQAVKKRMKR
jgi:hypothetical protein